MSIVNEKNVTDNPFIDEIMYYTKDMVYNAIVKNENKANKYETEESLKNGRLFRLCVERRATFDMLKHLITPDILRPVFRDDDPEEAAAKPSGYINPAFGINFKTASSDKSNPTGDLLGYRESIKSESIGTDIINEEGLRESTENIIIYYEYAMAVEYSQKPDMLPRAIKDEVVLKLQDKFVFEYVELNEYYRLLAGLPPLNEEGINIQDYYMECAISRGIYLKLGDNDTHETPIYLHNLDKEQFSIAHAFGIVDCIKRDYPDREYLNHLGEKRIGIYEARLAYNFQLLYLPVEELYEIRERFKLRYDINRDVVMKKVYSEAMAYGSDYYDEFIIMYILINTMIDVLARTQEIVERREFIDPRCIKYIFSIYQIPYYEEIPVKYQIRLMKNIHNLLKFKSTEKNMQDIAALFGFENIDICRWYILRRRKLENGSPVYNKSENDMYDEDPSDFEMNFIKVPIGDAPDVYIKNDENWLDYDETTLGDNYWDGELDHDFIKDQHSVEKFAYRKSKYLSIDTINDIGAKALQNSYFNGILYDNRNLDATHTLPDANGIAHIEPDMEDKILISVPTISTVEQFSISHLFILLYDLAFAYYGIKSTIQRDITKILYIQGFNFDNILGMFEKVKDDLWNKGYDITKMLDKDDPMYEGFDTLFAASPKVSNREQIVVSASELVDLFTHNMDVLALVMQEMFNADGYDTFKAYEAIYDAFFISKYNRDFFTDKWGSDGDDDPYRLDVVSKRNEKGEPIDYSDAREFNTLTEYLQNVQPTLYEIAREVRDITDDTARTKKINDIMIAVSDAIDKAIQNDDLMRNIYANLPGISEDFIKVYMYKIIDFFKSYRVQLYNTNSVLLLGGGDWGKYMSFLKMNDNTEYVSYMTKRDQFNCVDVKFHIMKTKYTDNFKLQDKMEIFSYKVNLDEEEEFR